MKKIRILQVTGGLGIGGIEKVATDFYKEIDRTKFEMHYLVYGEKIGKYEQEIVKLGGKIIRIPEPSKGYYKFYKNVCKAMIDNGPYDVVHTHVFFNSGLIVRAAAKNNIPIRIAHAHDNLSFLKQKITKRIYYIIMRKLLLRYSTKFCACSVDAGNFVFGQKHFEKNGVVLHNAIDINKFKFNCEKRINMRKQLKLKDNEVIIGNIGRLENQKNQEYLLKILKKLLVYNPNYKLILVGDGNLNLYLNQKIKLLGLEKNVIMTGNRLDIPDLLCAMDIFVLTSVHEGLGIVLIEAQANGLSCIAPKDIVPNEAKILDTFRFLPKPIDENLEEWTKALEIIPDRTEEVFNMIQKAGYDINMLKFELEKLYETNN